MKVVGSEDGGQKTAVSEMVCSDEADFLGPRKMYEANHRGQRPRFFSGLVSQSSYKSP